MNDSFVRVGHGQIFWQRDTLLSCIGPRRRCRELGTCPYIPPTTFRLPLHSPSLLSVPRCHIRSAVLVEPNIGRPTLIGRSIYLFRETLNMNIHNHPYSYNIHDEITAGHSQGGVVSRARPIRYTKSRLCRDADCSLKWAGSIGVSQKSPSPFGI